MRIIIAFCFLVWLYLVSVFRRAKLPFFKFLFGSVGMFVFSMILFQPLLTVPLSRLVAIVAGMAGNLMGILKAYYQYSLIFIECGDKAISMYIDYECSGIIEIFAYLSLLWFFPLYNFLEKSTLSVIGFVWIFFANVLRLLIICLLVHFFGDNIYYFAHAIFGRLIFYVLSVILYFYVFTKSQIIRQKVGRFNYGRTDN